MFGISFFKPANVKAGDPLPQITSSEDRLIQKIRKERLDSPAKEIDRLKKENLLTNKDIAALNKIFGKDNHSAAKALYAEAMAIRKVLGKTHHIFIHAQSKRWAVFNYLAKEIVKRKFPKLNVHQFKFIRSPKLLESLNYEGMKQYSDAKNLNDETAVAREDLISVDAYFNNTENCESSYYFLTHNSNILSDTFNIVSSTMRMVRKFYPSISEKEAEKISKDVEALLPKLNAEAYACGNLFVFCIPKYKSHEIQYRAHPYGKPCHCHGSTKTVEILEKLQNGVLDNETSCSSWFSWFPKVPQFRLYTPLLKPGSGIRSYLFSPVSKKMRQSIKKKIKALVSRLEKLNPHPYPLSGHKLKDVPKLFESLA